MLTKGFHMSKMLQKLLLPMSLVEDEDEFWPTLSKMNASDLSVYEDDSTVVVEAALPGIRRDEAEVIFHKGVLTIRANKQEESEDKKRKYYKKSNQTFLYRLLVPGEVDEVQEPKAQLENGIMKICFQKQKKEQPKKINIT